MRYRITTIVIHNLVFNPWVNIEDVTVLHLIAMAGTCRDPSPQQHPPRGRYPSWRPRRSTIISPWPRNCENTHGKSRVYPHPQVFGTFRNPESQWNLRRLEKKNMWEMMMDLEGLGLNFEPKKTVYAKRRLSKLGPNSAKSLVCACHLREDASVTYSMRNDPRLA